MSERPSDYFTITVNGEEREVFMSYGLLRTLSKIIENDPNKIHLLQMDDECHSVAVREMLAERKKSGKVKEPFTEEDFEDMIVDPSELVGLISWGVEHLIDFFTLKMEMMEKVARKNQARLEALMGQQLPSTG